MITHEEEKKVKGKPQKDGLVRWERLVYLFLLFFLTTVGCSPVLEEVKSSLGFRPEQELAQALTRGPDQWQGAQSQAAAVDSKVTEGQRVNKDPALNARLQKMVDRLRAVSHAPSIPFKVKIIDSDQINAFNTGGELLYVYTGLINYVESDDELAGIMAHEMAHGLGAHIQREQSSMFLPALGALLTSAALQNKNADQVIGLVNQAISSGYSRRHEREADILAVVYTSRAGYNPLSFEDFFQRISQEANKVKAEKEQGLRQVYGLYQQSAQNLDQEKRAYLLTSQDLQKNPTSQEAKNRRQKAQDRLQQAQKRHDQQHLKYQQTAQSYAQSISQLFPIFRSHPPDPERIDIVTKTYDYLQGKITLEQTPLSVQYVLTVLKDIEKSSIK